MTEVSGNLPDGLVLVQPRRIAKFHAVRLIDNTSISPINWMARQFGWKVVEREDLDVLIIHGRNHKRYVVKYGEWVVALGTNGSLRVCTDRLFRNDYKETGV